MHPMYDIACNTHTHVGNVGFLSNNIIDNQWQSMKPDSKVHGANMGPIWGRHDPYGPHIGPMNLVTRYWISTTTTTVFGKHSCVLMQYPICYIFDDHCVFPTYPFSGAILKIVSPCSKTKYKVGPSLFWYLAYLKAMLLIMIGSNGQAF